MSRNACFAASLALFAVAPALADTPAFDRPGIAFSTTTLPVGGLAWEQGLPDFVHDSGSGASATLYSAGTNVRIGLTPQVELQIGAALFNWLDADGGNESGIGDTSLALKAALPSDWKDFSWAVLGAVSLPTGDDPFTADDPQYDLGVTFSQDLDGDLSAAFYVNASHLDGDTTWSISPSLGVAISDRLGAYVEAGADFGASAQDRVAGGGLTWMLTPRVQLDESAVCGLNDETPDVAGGFGVSAYFE
ncbi:MAG TPA: transporter [Solimonas sp.]